MLHRHGSCADLSFPAIATYIRSMLLPRTHWIMRIAGVLRELGPYAAIELVLPGGTLIALAVWAIRHRRSSAARPLRRQRGDVVDEISHGRTGRADQAQATPTIEGENPSRVVDGVIIA
jgi:hypothetical protein